MENIKAADAIMTRDFNEDVCPNNMKEFIIEIWLFDVFDDMSNMKKTIIQRLSVKENVWIYF